MIRIINITEEGRGGGPLKRIRQVASELNQKGIRTLVLFPSKNSEGFQEDLINSNVDFKAISLHRLTKQFSHLFAYLLFFIPQVWRIKKIISKEKAILIHCNSAWQIKGIIASKFTSCKSVWHLNDSQSAGVVKLLFKIFSPLADGFIFASHRSKSYYTGLKPSILAKPNAVIQAPVRLDHFTIKESEVLKEYVGLKILSVGYVNRNKGFHKLIQALPKIQEAIHKEVHLFIAGTVFENQQEYKNELDKIIDENNIKNVHFLGFRKDIDMLINNIDVYACSSDFEASPISVWEAMACGKPIVSTDVGDIKELFEKEENINTVHINDIDGLSSKLISALKLELTTEDSEALRQLANHHFSLGGNVQNHRNFYLKMVGSN